MTRKFLRASVAALATGALMGCVDALIPSRPHAHGMQLGIAPVFDGFGTHGGIPSDIDLIRIVLHLPPAADTTLDFPVTPGQDSITIEIPVTLPSSLDTLGVTFYAIRSSDGDTLYQGTQDYPLQVGLPIPSSPLVATYVGPGKNILSIAIKPPAATIKPGDSLAFNFLALDSSGATIIGMPVLFDSRNLSVATVNAAGEARGVALGATYIVVTSGARSSVRDSALLTISNVAAPEIALSAATATFVDTALTSDPPAQTLNVTNAAGGVLSDLAVGTIAYGAGGSGWLTATLASASAPTTLALSVAKGTLAAGTYTATVPVQSATATNSPQNVAVTLTVAPVPLVTLGTAPGYRVMAVGDTVTLAATGKDGSGNPATPFGLTYASRSPGVATVNASTGLITAVGSGRAVIVAQAPTATGQAADSTLIVVPASGSAVVAAIGDARAFDVAKVGDTLRVLVLVDLKGVPGDTLGSYNAELDWSATTLKYASAAAVSGGFAAPTINATNTGAGQLRFGSADPTGSAGAFALILVKFTGAAAGSSPLTLTLTDLSTAKTFVQLLPAAAIVSGSATIH